MSKDSSNINRPPRPFEYTLIDQTTGQLCWISDMTRDYWGRWVHKGWEQTPSPMEYAVLDFIEPYPEILTSEYSSDTETSGLRTRYFVNSRTNLTTIWRSSDYSPGQYTEATAAQVTSYLPVVNDQTFNFGLESAPSNAQIGILAVFDPSGNGITWQIDTYPHLGFYLAPSTGVLYASQPELLAIDTPYQLTVRATSNFPGGIYDTAVITINTVSAPVITGTGSSGSASVSIDENTTAVLTFTATDPNASTITWSINGGADAALFTIGSSSGILSFLVAPDYEIPTDANTDNIYLVTVRATNVEGIYDTVNVTVTVIDVDEWNPSLYGTIIANWDAYDSGSITETGSGVSQWNDLSGNNHTLIQTTDADRPSYSLTAGIRAKPGIIFDRANSEFLISNEAPSAWTFLQDTNAHTIVVVFQQNNIAGIGSPFGIITTAPATLSGQSVSIYYRNGTSPNDQIRCQRNGTTDDEWGVFTFTLVTSRSMVFISTWDEAVGTDAEIYVDGVSQTTGNIVSVASGTDPVNTLNIGTFASDTASRCNDMIVHQILIYDSVLSPANITALQAAIEARWGVGGST